MNHDELLRMYSKDVLIQFLTERELLFSWDGLRLAEELEKVKIWMKYEASHQKANAIFERKKCVAAGTPEWWALTDALSKTWKEEDKWAGRL